MERPYVGEAMSHKTQLGRCNKAHVNKAKRYRRLSLTYLAIILSSHKKYILALFSASIHGIRTTYIVDQKEMVGCLRICEALSLSHEWKIQWGYL